MKTPSTFRKINHNETCCNISRNLKQAIDNDESVIDGIFTCSVCNKTWVGNGKDEYLDHPLETLTDYGKEYLQALDAVVKENKPLRHDIVMGKMANTIGKTKFEELMSY